jgi:hypothetical protein
MLVVNYWILCGKGVDIVFKVFLSHCKEYGLKSNCKIIY